MERLLWHVLPDEAGECARQRPFACIWLLGGDSDVFFLPFFVVARNPLTFLLLSTQNPENVDEIMLRF